MFTRKSDEFVGNLQVNLGNRQRQLSERSTDRAIVVMRPLVRAAAPIVRLAFMAAESPGMVSMAVVTTVRM
jgi:hypothetical protein